MFKEPENFYIVDYTEGSCGHFMSTLLITMLANEKDAILWDHYRDAVAAGHWSGYAKEHLSLPPEKARVWDVKLKQTSPFDSVVVWGVPSSPEHYNLHYMDPNDYFDTFKIPKNLKYVAITYEKSDLLLIKTLFYYKNIWQFKHWYEEDKEQYSKQVRDLFDDFDFANDGYSKPYSEISLFLNEFIEIRYKRNFLNLEVNKFSELLSKLKPEYQQYIHTMKFSDVWYNPEMTLQQLSEITGKPITPYIRELYQLYINENIKHFDQFGIKVYST